MKTIVIGDIHARPHWEEIINREGFRDRDDMRAVFLGDYVSTHERYSPWEQVAELMDILEFKQEWGDRVILLRGNHDIQHLGFYWAQCSGYFPDVAAAMSEEDFKERFLRLTQWTFRDGDILYSHAGVSNRWMKDNNIQSINDINDMPCSERFAFCPDSPLDYSGDSVTQPPVWIRPMSLIGDLQKNKGWPDGIRVQVVGHTPVSRIAAVPVKIESTGKTFYVACCDNLPKGYAVIDPGSDPWLEYKTL